MTPAESIAARRLRACGHEPGLTYSTGIAARVSGKCRDQVRRRCVAGDIEATRPGGHWRISWSGLVQLVEISG